jgi:hypothetical protein
LLLGRVVMGHGAMAHPPCTSLDALFVIEPTWLPSPFKLCAVGQFGIGRAPAPLAQRQPFAARCAALTKGSA